MKILIVDAPGVHPAGGARALAAVLHREGYSAIVHPMRTWSAPWYRRGAARALAARVVEAHRPDVVHVFAADPALADAFTGLGQPVVHSAYDRASRADFLFAPSPGALRRLRRAGPRVEGRVELLPYPAEVAGDDAAPPSAGIFVLARASDEAGRARRDALRRALPGIPLRDDGDPAAARAVVACSDEELWPAAIVEGLAAGRPVLSSWAGRSSELVLEGVTGFLSAPEDVASLAAHVRYLWDDPSEADRLGAAARAEARHEFGGAAHVRPLLRAYFRAGTSRLAV